VSIEIPEFVLLVAGIAVVVFIGMHWRRRRRK
jgi:LPXTG-motif cell wall-anchored protein